MNTEYDVVEFTRTLKEEGSLALIIQKIDWEIDRVKKASFLVKGAVKARASGSQEFVECLNRLRQLARLGALPNGTSFRESGAYQSLFEDLVARSIVPACILENWKATQT